MPSSTSSQENINTKDNNKNKDNSKTNSKDNGDKKKKNIFNRRLEVLKQQVMEIMDQNEIDDEIKNDLKSVFDKAATDMKVCRDMENSKDCYMLQSKSFKDGKQARKVAMEIIAHKSGNPLPDNAVQTNVKVIKGKRQSYFKIQTEKFDTLHTTKPDGGKQSIGQTMLENIGEFNKARNEEDRVYISREIPRCLKGHFKNLEESAYKIRQASTDKKKYITKIHLDSTTLRPAIKVKWHLPKARGKNTTSEWYTMEDEEVKKELDETCMNIYKKAIKKNTTIEIPII